MTNQIPEQFRAEPSTSVLENRIEKLERTLALLYDALNGDAGAPAGREAAACALRNLICEVLESEGWRRADKWNGCVSPPPNLPGSPTGSLSPRRRLRPSIGMRPTTATQTVRAPRSRRLVLEA